MNREELALRAEELCGGETGYTKHFDPLGYFALVTEGRQRSWIDPKTGQKRTYSACEDLETRVAFEVCGEKTDPPMPWCNREDAGNDWIPAQNLGRLKRLASFAWKAYGPQTDWDIELGDGVQVQGGHGPHTFIVTRIVFELGIPVSCSHADYGQFPDPDESGPEPADHGARVYHNVPITRTSGGWRVGGNPVIGRVNNIALRDYEFSRRDTPLATHAVRPEDD